MKDFVKIFLLLFVLSVAKAGPLLVDGDWESSDEGEWEEKDWDEDEWDEEDWDEEEDEEEWDEENFDEGDDEAWDEEDENWDKEDEDWDEEDEDWDEDEEDWGENDKLENDNAGDETVGFKDELTEALEEKHDESEVADDGENNDFENVLERLKKELDVMQSKLEDLTQEAADYN